MSDPPPPDPAALAGLLDRFAPLRPVPLAPEILAFHADGLVSVWEAAEALAGQPLPSPFWAYPWPGGAALARVLLDRPELVRGRVVLDIGCGGGVASLAAARAGARRIVANDTDPWALVVTRLAAERQGLQVDTVEGDLAAESTATATATAVSRGEHGGHGERPGSAGSGAAEGLRQPRVPGCSSSLQQDPIPASTGAPSYAGGPGPHGPCSPCEIEVDVVLCGDMGYERTVAPRVRRLLDHFAAAGADVLVADPGRAYFDAAGLDELARFTVAVPQDLEGVAERTATVYTLASVRK